MESFYREKEKKKKKKKTGKVTLSPLKNIPVTPLTVAQNLAKKNTTSLNFISHFENRRDVIAYFIKGKTETHALLSVCGGIQTQLQKKKKKSTTENNAGTHLEMHYDVMSNLEVR